MDVECPCTWAYSEDGWKRTPMVMRNSNNNTLAVHTHFFCWDRNVKIILAHIKDMNCYNLSVNLIRITSPYLTGYSVTVALAMSLRSTI